MDGKPAERGFAVAGLKSGHYKRKSAAPSASLRAGRNRCATQIKKKQVPHPVRKTNGVRNDKLWNVAPVSQAETLKLAPEAADGAVEDEVELLGANRWRSCWSEE